MATSQEVKDGYTSTLQDLTCNSKPLISVLTMLAEENVAHAKEIVAAIEEHLAKVQPEVKLPVLYLIDCIIKNVGGPYTTAFCSSIVNLFCSVFAVVDEKTRTEMYKLRQTWNDVIPKSKLYTLDMKTSQLDPAWPITAAPPNIHFNPKFLNSTNAKVADKVPIAAKPVAATAVPTPTAIQSTLDMQQKLLLKQKQLLDLQQKKLELELLQTQVKLQEQMKKQTDDQPKTSNSKLLLKPEVAKQLLSKEKDESAKAMLAQINQRFPLANPMITQMQTSANQLNKSTNILSASVRPAIRDPRLLRQQATLPTALVAHATTEQLEISSNNTQNSTTLDNKVVSNKSGRDTTRFIDNNKDETNIQPKNKTQSRIPLKKRSSSSPPKSSKSSASTRNVKCASGSSSSLDSPKKTGRALSKSPSKSASSKHKSKSSRIAKRSSSNKRSNRRSPAKDAKTRNYRRHRAISISPELENSKDVDLRIGGPPEKLARMNDDTRLDHDADARKSVTNLVGAKKRPSELAESQTCKKNRADKFDALFGTEDVDLRKLPTAEPDRMITPPPPPIISNKLIEKENTNGVHATDNARALSLDVLRAKLANTTNANKSSAMKSRQSLQLEQQKLLEKFAKKDERVIVIDDADKAKSQENTLLNKIIAQMDHKSKRKEIDENARILTQAIGDDEFELDALAESRAKEPSSVAKSRYESRYARDAQWKGKRSGFIGPRPNRGRTDPWIRPIQQTAIWGGHPLSGGVPSVEDEKSSDAMELSSPPPPIQLQDDVCISHENIKSINIDGEPRDILFYGETAVALMTPEDPREISFQSGQRRVSFDETNSCLLAFNDPYREVLISGHCHRIRLGAPTREIYIDGMPYECIFGGPPIGIELDRKLVMMKIDGPPPQVMIGKEKRTDLLLGKVSLIIDAATIVTVYLDARLQTFEVDGTVTSLRFKDSLQSVLINDQPFQLEFGGLPKGVVVNGRKHFIRFSVLPPHIQPGRVLIRDMEGFKPSLSDIADMESETPASAADSNQPTAQAQRPRKSRFSDHSPERQSPSIPPFGNMDSLLSIASSSLIPPLNPNAFQTDPSSTLSQLPDGNAVNTMPVTAPAPVLNSLNINDLFQKLVATGIVSTLQPNSQQSDMQQLSPHSVLSADEERQFESAKRSPPHIELQLKPVNFNDPLSLKVRQPAMIQMFYSGMQCSSCGMRFAQENSNFYSQHLDWHFRQNRKGKKNIRKASSRRWYYSISDWRNYEEVDLEDKEKCYFENQGNQHDSNYEGNDGEIEIPSVPTDLSERDPRCDVCQEKFEQFYNEEKEEWHLRMAIRIDDRTYHPLCYDDYQASLIMDEESDADQPNVTMFTTEPEVRDEVALIPGLDVEMTESPNAPVILDCESENTQNSQKSEAVIDIPENENETKTDASAEEENVATEKSEAVEDDGDDDVIINEVEPEKIILDDYEVDENGLIPGVVVKQEPVDDGFTDIENFKLGDSQLTTDGSKSQGESFVDIGQICETQPVVPTSISHEAVARTPSPPTKSRPSSPSEQSDSAQTIEEDTSVQTNTINALLTPAVHSSSSHLIGNDPLLTVPTIDGNLDCKSGAPVQAVPPGGISGRIKINISKPLPVSAPKENKDISLDNDNHIEPTDPTQPLPPGEEPVQLHLKPVLQGIALKQLPPVKKGSELTGLCSIM